MSKDQHSPMEDEIKKCVQCGHIRETLETRCPNCGSLNAKIDGILAREEAEHQRHTLAGRLKTLLNAENKREAFFVQFKSVKDSLPEQSLFILFVVFVFVFALIFSVM